MDNTQVQANPPPAAPAPLPDLPPPAAAPPPRNPGGVGRVLYKALLRLASLRITVVLFVLSVILVFCGTLAQVDAGIWTVVSRYFRSFYVWIPFRIFFPRDWVVSGGFPFPGG